MILDKKKSHRNLLSLLRRGLLPIHYKQPGLLVMDHLSNKRYSEKTDATEKFRQYYAETYRSDIGICEGGFYVLREWFPRVSANGQLSLLPPENTQTIEGNCLVSYDAGYEQAQRSKYMKDHLGDKGTIDAYERQRRGALVEAHVKSYFRIHWPEFYVPATNQGQYATPSCDDFSLAIPDEKLLVVDVKSESYINNQGQGVSVVRNPKKSLIYIHARYCDDQTTEMKGFYSGDWCQNLGIHNARSGLIHIPDNHLWPISALFVFLNMAKGGLSYKKFVQTLRQESYYRQKRNGLHRHVSAGVAL